KTGRRLLNDEFFSRTLIYEIRLQFPVCEHDSPPIVIAIDLLDAFNLFGGKWCQAGEHDVHIVAMCRKGFSNRLKFRNVVRGDRLPCFSLTDDYLDTVIGA